MNRLYRLLSWLQPIALLTAALVANPAAADVDLRVVARPITDPIQAFVRVTDANGNPVSGLTSADFAVTLDGVALNNFTFTLPPDQNPAQRVSVVFAMDYSSSVTNVALAAMQDAITSFIDRMVTGDYAAIIKFNDTNPDQASVVQAFTAIDDGDAGDSALNAAVMAPYPGDGTNLLDAVNLAVDTIVNPGITLPSGPKVVILISDGGENSSVLSQSDVIDNAHANSIAVFTIGVGDIAAFSVREEMLNSLADDTGGDYFEAPDDLGIADAYATISELLNNEYLLTIPQTAITDCDQHTLDVTVQGETASLLFHRCDNTPDDFSFTNATNVEPGSIVTSNAVTITGIDTPAAISVDRGEYSIGCGATFTSVAGTIAFNQTVCVRHTAAATFSTRSPATVLFVGGVTSSFRSTTEAAPAPPSGGGGGGATGIAELLIGLGALLARRRRRS